MKRKNQFDTNRPNVVGKIFPELQTHEVMFKQYVGGTNIVLQPETSANLFSTTDAA